MARHEEFGNVNIWWFPKNFCQCRFGDYRDSGTNSCTLIALIIAEKVSKMSILTRSISELPEAVWNLIGDSINEGNIVYRDCMSNMANLNINIPDALAVLRAQNTNLHLEEWFFTQVSSDPLRPMLVGVELTRIFSVTLEAFQKGAGWDAPPYLFAAIVADCRTVLVAIDLRTSIVAIIDTHLHGYDVGALFAQSTLHCIGDLLFWFISMLDYIYSSHPTLFEISFLCAMQNVALRIPPAVEQVVKNKCTSEKRSDTVGKL